MSKEIIVMNPEDFEVGEVYANRRGRYEVESISPGHKVMEIRYVDSGELITTPTALQARISRNMRWERQEARRRAKKEERRFLRGYGKDFAGLDESDFKETITGTRWRRRGELPGRIARDLSLRNSEFTFTSWAVARAPVAFLTHRENYEKGGSSADNLPNAKYTIELNENNMYYGFFIERKSGTLNEEWDWVRFMDALREDEDVREAIRSAEETYGARFIARRADEEGYTYTETSDEEGAELLWTREEVDDMTIDDRIEQIQEMSNDEWGEVFIITRMNKEDALAMGEEVADEIVSFMELLLPIYTAAVD